MDLRDKDQCQTDRKPPLVLKTHIEARWFISLCWRKMDVPSNHMWVKEMAPFIVLE